MFRKSRVFLDTLADRLHASLGNSTRALEYLQGRGVTTKDAQDLRIGYSRVIGIAEDGSVDCENFKKETYNGRKFEDKIVFPLTNVMGQVVGLFGRAIDTKEFKFFLTEEGKFTGVLLGLSAALSYVYRSGIVFVVEGPFDLIAFRKVYPNVISSLTAGISENQYALLDLFAKKIVLCFDSDKAGEHATKEAQEKWPGILSISLGFKDPDACLKYYGLKKFQQRVREKVRQHFFNEQELVCQK